MDEKLFEAIKPWAQENILGQKITDVEFIPNSVSCYVTFENGIKIGATLFPIEGDNA